MPLWSSSLPTCESDNSIPTLLPSRERHVASPMRVNSTTFRKAATLPSRKQKMCTLQRHNMKDCASQCHQMEKASIGVRCRAHGLHARAHMIRLADCLVRCAAGCKVSDHESSLAPLHALHDVPGAQAASIASPIKLTNKGPAASFSFSSSLPPSSQPGTARSPSCFIRPVHPASRRRGAYQMRRYREMIIVRGF